MLLLLARISRLYVRLSVVISRTMAEEQFTFHKSIIFLRMAAQLRKIASNSDEPNEVLKGSAAAHHRSVRSGGARTGGAVGFGDLVPVDRPTHQTGSPAGADADKSNAV